MEGNDAADALQRLFRRRERVVAVGVLAKEIPPDHLGCVHHQPVRVLQPFGAHDLGNLTQCFRIFQKSSALACCLFPCGRDGAGEMFHDLLFMEGIALEPVYGRELPAVRKGGVEHQERPGRAQAGLRYRFGEIAARRGDGKDHAERAYGPA